jgi:hypothetical protein
VKFESGQREDVMKTMFTTILALFGWVLPALAATGNVEKSSSILLILFLGFFALIIVFQFVPGLILFFSMLKGIFTTASKRAATTRNKG